MNPIKYIGYFDHETNSAENREFALSAATKMSYVSETLNRLGQHVLIVSPSQTRARHSYPAKTITLNERTKLKLFSTLGRGNAAKRALRWVLTSIKLWLYLVLNTRRDETVIVYHSLALQDAVRAAKLLRKFRLVLEVEEIYQDVVKVPAWVRRSEFATFAAADAYIFSTELLNDKLNARGMPHVVLYGTYRAEAQCQRKLDDNRVHVVYAGTLDPRKGGAAAAVAAASHLDAAFHIHILGVGAEREVFRIREAIASINQSSSCGLTYDGVLRGGDFVSFLQKCSIGLSTQDPAAAFNDTSFPSKILTYLANDLRVVSIRIPAVLRSRVASSVVFYDEQRPELIAEAVRQAAGRDLTGREVLAELDADFVLALAKLLGYQKHPALVETAQSDGR